MTTVRLTKRFVIETLKREPVERLTTGSFVEGGVVASDPACVSCAVGTLFKRCVDAETDSWKLADHANELIWSTDGDWCERDDDSERKNDSPIAIVAEEPLRALSLVYESAGGYGPGRRAAVAFARKHFPSHITLDIDGMKPRKARGVTVVKAKKVKP